MRFMVMMLALLIAVCIYSYRKLDMCNKTGGTYAIDTCFNIK